MKRRIAYVLLLILPISTQYPQQLPKPDHIVIVIEENHGYDQIMGNSSAPYINSLVDDTLSALFTDAHGITHPSQPNYLWLFSGDNQGVTDDNPPADTPFTTLNLGSELLSKGKTFAGYSEDLQYTGSNISSNGSYKRKHNPWVNWQDSNQNGIPWYLNLSFSDFPTDYNSLPTVSFVVPNENNDMHSGSISQADTWLKNNLDEYIQWAKSHKSIFILTFDEDDGSNSNWILTLFIGQNIRNGEYSQSINHLNLLRTIEDMYGLNYTGSSGDSSLIKNCWNTILSDKDDINQPNTAFELYQNYPNPFNPVTSISYSLPKEELVTLKVYDILGNEINTIVNEKKLHGYHTVKFDASKLPSGIYLYQLRMGIYTLTKKMVVIR